MSDTFKIGDLVSTSTSICTDNWCLRLGRIHDIDSSGVPSVTCILPLGRSTEAGKDCRKYGSHLLTLMPYVPYELLKGFE